MRLIDRIVSVDEETAVTESTVTACWPMLQGNATNPVALIEVVAQTAAVSIGWKEVHIKGKKGGNKGWLVGIKKADFRVTDLPIGTRITTHTQKGFHFENYHEISGNVQLDGETVCEAVLQVFWSEEDETSRRSGG